MNIDPDEWMDFIHLILLINENIPKLHYSIASVTNYESYQPGASAEDRQSELTKSLEACSLLV